MRAILSLDLATRTGFAVGPPNGEPRFGAHVLPSTGDNVGRFLNAFEVWLNDMIALEDPAVIVFEAPILTAGRTTPATARKLMGLAGETEQIADKRGIRVMEANLMTVKKFFVGTGRADGPAMIAAAHRHGWMAKRDDEADALGVWAFAVHTLAPKHAARFSLGQLGGQHAPGESGQTRGLVRFPA